MEAALAEKKEAATAEQVVALEQEIATLKAEKEKVATEGKALSEALGEAMALNDLKSNGDAIADICCPWEDLQGVRGETPSTYPAK